MEVLMRLSRKREREFERLKREAEELIREQREVLSHASHVAGRAGHNVADFARDEVAPRVRRTYEKRVRPAAAAAVGSAVGLIEAARHLPVRETLSKVSRSAREAGAKAGLVEPPKSAGPARYIFIGVALVAAAGVAYAAWQTLRADDSLWVEDEPDLNAELVSDV
jgi:hypothetical protein